MHMFAKNAQAEKATTISRRENCTDHLLIQIQVEGTYRRERKKLLLIIISAFRKEKKIKTFPDKAFSALGEGATWTVLRVLYD